MKSSMWFVVVCGLLIGGIGSLSLSLAQKEVSAQDSSVAANADQDTISFGEAVIAGAKKEVFHGTVYHETYEKLDYPGGDVSPDIGVCTDLVVRAFRAGGIDLQKELHEDSSAHPEAYPTELWEYKKPDKNIDHRRCQNLVAYFKRHALEVDSTVPSEWLPGDVIFFVRDGREHPWHVGIVADQDSLYHLYPPKAAPGRIADYGPVHSVFRWPSQNRATGDS